MNNSLIQDVIDFFEKEEMLTGQALYATKDFPCHRRTLHIRVCAHDFYLADIDAKEDALWRRLNDFLFENIMAWQVMYDQFCIDDRFSFLDEVYETITSCVIRNKRLEQLANSLCHRVESSTKCEYVRNMIKQGTVAIAHQIIGARIVTGGIQFGATEACFQAMKDGLVPFGYDVVENTIVCIAAE